MRMYVVVVTNGSRRIFVGGTASCPRAVRRFKQAILLPRNIAELCVEAAANLDKPLLALAWEAK